MISNRRTQVLIGHRGVGKSSLLNRLRSYFPDQLIGDLDQEIEKVSGQSIADIFQTQGEAAFREQEVLVLSQMLSQKTYAFIALGAGFPISQLPQDLDVIWIRRRTDALPRIFSDRPRLNSSLSAGDEYLERFQAREQNYRKAARWDYVIPEGHFLPSKIEKSIFDKKASFADAMWTVPSENATQWSEILKLNFRKFELRDDLLSEDGIQDFLRQIGPEKILLSLRRKNLSKLFYERLRGQYPDLECDWGLENNSEEDFEIPRGCQIISLHHREEGESLQQSLTKLQERGGAQAFLKLAVEILNFSELAAGLAWQAEDPVRRSFLPRSEVGPHQGRWSWVRCYLRGRQRIHFLKLLDGSAADQPTPFQWLATSDQPHKFAAVLGSPVYHSWSPEMHRDFFAQKQMPFWSIEITEPEWSVALPLLQKMGLVAAAVTAPLKTVAGSANTLWLTEARWHRANTDGAGFQSLISFARLQNIPESKIFVWGGGGTLLTLKEALPQARYFSVRTGRNRNLNESKVDVPEVVVWAASPEAPIPPADWRPALVLDLNYREDSRAKEFAQKVQAKYVSGEEMFRAQALQQQKLWSDL